MKLHKQSMSEIISQTILIQGLILDYFYYLAFHLELV